MREIAVLGGGLGGLSCSYYLKRKGFNSAIHLFEASNRLGGWVKSHKLPDNILFEQGPRTIRPRGQAGASTLQLVDELGLQSEVLPIPMYHPAAKNRYIYAREELHRLPSSVFQALQNYKLLDEQTTKILFRELWIKPKQIEDESMYDFTCRRFGKQIAEYVISPLLCGICAGDARQISVKFIFRELFELEQKYGSVLKGMVLKWFDSNTSNTSNIPESGLHKRALDERWAIYSFKNGCETLPQALERSIQEQGVDIQLNASCKEIEFGPASNYLCFENKDEKVPFNHLVSALPAQKLSTLVERQHPTLSKLLAEIPSTTVAVLNLHYKGQILKAPSFGVLIAPAAKRPILGVIFDSFCFPNNNGDTVLTVMVGGHWFQEYFGDAPDPLFIEETALFHLREILGIRVKPIQSKTTILRHCIPQYIVGHDNKLIQIQKYIEENKLPLSLCGASYNGVGVNDVLYSAKTAVDQLSIN